MIYIDPTDVAIHADEFGIPLREARNRLEMKAVRETIDKIQDENVRDVLEWMMENV
jgi:hypothetical protein